MEAKMFNNIPITHPKPDSKKFINHLLGKEQMPVVPLVEYNIDDTHIRRIIGKFLNRK